MRTIAHVLSAYLVMVLGSVLWRILPFEAAAPVLPAVFALYLGATRRDRLPAATAGAVMIGYLADLLAGTPRGLLALVAGVICLCARVVSSRLLVRGRSVVAGFAFASALGAAAMVDIARLVFHAPLAGVWRELLTAFTAALLTAAVSPLLFRLCRSIDSAFARTDRDREAAREGYLG